VRDGEDAEETPPAGSDEDTPSADHGSKQDDVTVEDPASDDSADQQASSGNSFRAAKAANADVVSSVTAAVGQPTPSGGNRSQMRRAAVVADTPTNYASADAFATAATTFTAAAAAADPAPAEPQRPTIVSVVTDFVAAMLRPLISPGPWSPIQPTLLLGVLSAVRNEIERTLFPRTAPVASQYTVTQLDPTPDPVPADPTPNVLVIGVDGTTLSRILADDRNQNFFDLMEDSTTAASSIVGIPPSQPVVDSHPDRCVGRKDRRHQQRLHPVDIRHVADGVQPTGGAQFAHRTTAIADWDVINAISGAASIPVDEKIYIPQIEGDTDWSETDDAVGEATVDAVVNTPEGVLSFLFSYFVGVDENRAYVAARRRSTPTPLSTSTKTSATSWPLWRRGRPPTRKRVNGRSSWSPTTVTSRSWASPRLPNTR
jgi:hypothetical protein